MMVVMLIRMMMVMMRMMMRRMVMVVMMMMVVVVVVVARKLFVGRVYAWVCMGMHVHTLQGVVDVMIIVPVPTYNEKHGGKAIFKHAGFCNFE